MVRMGLIVALPLLVRVRREASTSSSNSVGVAITQPRVAGEARYPGYIYIIRYSNSYRVAKIVGAATQGREAPSQPSPRGRSQSQPHKTQQEWTPAPWGGLGRGFYPQSQPSPEGGRSIHPHKNTARMDSRPLGRVGEGLLSTTPTTTTNISRIFSSSTKITTIFTT